MGDIEKIDIIVKNKIYDFCKKYNDKPNFIKIPFWAYEGLKIYMKQLTTYSVIKDDDQPITYRNLLLCPTTSIYELDEIEVF